jgi:uncharacterized membrane protein
MTSLNKNRIESIDLLKGIVMVIMALDHTRDYFHSAAYLFNPADPTQSTLPIFFSRWITHFCAPTFSFLAGLSAYMVGKRKSPKELSSFLLKRGIWLVFIELTVVTFAWQFDPLFRINGFAVIAVLGFSMILLAGLIHLPKTVLWIFSIVLIFGHNLLDGIHFPGSFLWSWFHEAAIIYVLGGIKFYIDYPIIPWVGIMSLGYCFGTFYDSSFDAIRRRKMLNIIGISAIVLFVVLRWSNIYGDPIKWINIDGGARTLMSFLQISKYPPSLLYSLITLGGAFIFLANSEKLKGKLVNFFSTFGRVPFFYYIIHICLIHLLAMLFAELSGFGWQLMVLPDWILESPELKGYGFSLGVVYLVWIGVILALYPLCKKFDNYKMNHKEKSWLSYF